MATRKRPPVLGRATSKLFRAVQNKLRTMNDRQRDLVETRLDLTPGTLYRWQTGRVQSPGVDNVERVAYLLRIDLEISERAGVVGERKRKTAKGVPA